MKREQALETIRGAEEELRRMGIVGAAIFGSVARGEETADSDVDIAVVPGPGRKIAPRSLLSLYGILGDAFHYEIPIDVVVLPARNADLNAAIERDSVFAFS